MRTAVVWFEWRVAWKGVRAGGWSSLAAVAALALGTAGAITAAAIAYSGLLRPLPFPQPAELVTLHNIFTPTATDAGITLSQFEAWRASVADTARLAAYSREGATVRNAGAPREVQAAYVAGPFFDVFGMRAQSGRTFTEQDGVDVAVVSHDFALALARMDATAPASAAHALNRSFTVAGRPLRIVGVMPRTFAVVGEVDFWTPAHGVEQLNMFGKGDARHYMMVARLVPGASIARFRANAQAAVQQFAPENQRGSWQARVTTLHDDLSEARARCCWPSRRHPRSCC
jgi:putative ABC transport system permease protein